MGLSQEVLRKNLSLQWRKALLRSPGKSTKPQSIYRGLKSAHEKRSGIPRARLSLKEGRKKKPQPTFVNKQESN